MVGQPAYDDGRYAFCRRYRIEKAQIEVKLTAGGKNVQMKEWYAEYRKLQAELQAAKAAHTNATAPDVAQ